MKRKTDNFNKFYNKKNNAAIKESFKQEKKAAKKERREAIERHFEERRQTKSPQDGKPHRHPGIPAKGPLGKGAHAVRREAPVGKGPHAPKHEAPIGKSLHVGKHENPRAAKHDGPKGAKDEGPKGATRQGPKGTADASSKSAGHEATGEQLPLNKYIAHGGICSRRDAAELIRQGKVTVNGKPVTEPGTKVQPTDLVKVNGKKVTMSRNFVYILLNKPKDYLTTMDDPQGRRTVVDLVRAATTERIFPVGRLDRNTSGVLLLTNDGDLSQKLAHPSHEIKKIYHVTLDKALTKADFDKVVGGVMLEDGPAHVDVIAYADPKDRAQIGLEIHSGRNRIVRRIFEHLGYDVRGLDRVMYATLTKKNVQRGKWRFLTEKEVRILKYLNSSMKGSAARAKDWAAAAEPVSRTAAATADPIAEAAKEPSSRPPFKGVPAKRSSTAHKAPGKPAGRRESTNQRRKPLRPGKTGTSKPSLRPRQPKPRPEKE